MPHKKKYKSAEKHEDGLAALGLTHEKLVALAKEFFAKHRFETEEEEYEFKVFVYGE